MYMEVAVRAQKTYLLVLLHKDQVRLRLGQTDLTAQLDLLNITQVLSGRIMVICLLLLLRILLSLEAEVGRAHLILTEPQVVAEQVDIELQHYLLLAALYIL
jgi:hypothetical protein